jgi:hypothetical protein
MLSDSVLFCAALLQRALRATECALDNEQRLLHACALLYHASALRPTANAEESDEGLDRVLDHARRSLESLEAAYRAARADPSARSAEDEPAVDSAAGLSLAEAGLPLRVGPEGRWFAIDDGPRVEFRRQRALRGILLALARRATDEPGRACSLDDLTHAGWPDEHILAPAARNRVYVAISLLRRYGLARLLSRDDGWLFHPGLRVELVEESDD